MAGSRFASYFDAYATQCIYPAHQAAKIRASVQGRGAMALLLLCYYVAVILDSKSFHGSYLIMSVQEISPNKVGIFTEGRLYFNCIVVDSNWCVWYLQYVLGNSIQEVLQRHARS